LRFELNTYELTRISGIDSYIEDSKDGCFLDFIFLISFSDLFILDNVAGRENSIEKFDNCVEFSSLKNFIDKAVLRYLKELEKDDKKR